MRDYFFLYKTNKNYRNIFLAISISLFGDWFNFVALTHILLKLSNDNSAIAFLFIIHLIPFVIFTPFAGVLADKISRKKMMLRADFFRFLIVLGYLAGIYFESVPLLLTLVTLHYIFSAFFEPSRSAIIPNIVSKNEIAIANGGLSAMWSLMMAAGMGLGGLTVHFFSVEIAIVLDASTFLLSYFLIKKIELKESHINETYRFKFSDFFKFGEIKEGLSYLKKHIFMVPIVLAKGALEIYVGAFVFFLTLYGEGRFSVLGSAALGIGTLQMARGIGTGIGPIISRKYISGLRGEYYSIWVALGLAPVAYYLFSMQTSIITGFVLIVIAHMGGSASWVTSENLIHKLVPDNLRGRVVSFEFMFLTLMMALSVKGGEVMLDLGITLDDATQWFAWIGLATAGLWGVLSKWCETVLTNDLELKL